VPEHPAAGRGCRGSVKRRTSRPGGRSPGSCGYTGLASGPAFDPLGTAPCPACGVVPETARLNIKAFVELRAAGPRIYVRLGGAAHGMEIAEAEQLLADLKAALDSLRPPLPPGPALCYAEGPYAWRCSLAPGHAAEGTDHESYEEHDLERRRISFWPVTYTPGRP
jgi:hypothetical protein